MYSLVKFAMENKVLRIENEHWNDEHPPNLGSVTVLGLEKPVAHVNINGISRNFQFDTVHKVSIFHLIVI